MRHLPLFQFQHDFTANGDYNPFTVEQEVIPLLVLPNKWALEVFGLDDAGTVQAPTAWDVLLLGGITRPDLLTYPDGSVIIEHKNASHVNGQLVYSDGNLRACRFVALRLKSLNLGASATKLRVNVLGDR